MRDPFPMSLPKKTPTEMITFRRGLIGVDIVLYTLHDESCFSIDDAPLEVSRRNSLLK